MLLAVFGSSQVGVVTGNEIHDVSQAVPGWTPDPANRAGWWRALCASLPKAAARLEEEARRSPAVPLDEVSLASPVVAPSKLIAAASNYKDHVSEMHGVQERTLGHVESWMMNFDVFLKAPSSVVGPAGPIVLPSVEVAAGHEIHHECELVVVVGKGGKRIPVEDALEHVAGYSIGLDITVRSAADRSRRKSYDTFSPIGPVLRVNEDGLDPAQFHITLRVNGEVRQDVVTADLITPVPEIVSYASSVMTLEAGDVLFTGAPPGVGPIEAGDRLLAEIEGIGAMTLQVTEDGIK